MFLAGRVKVFVRINESQSRVCPGNDHRHMRMQLFPGSKYTFLTDHAKWINKSREQSTNS